MMLGSVNKVIGVYNVTINSLNGKFRLQTEVTKVDRGTLLSLDNPRYAEVIDKYPHLTGVRMIDGDKKGWTSSAHYTGRKWLREDTNRDETQDWKTQESLWQSWHSLDGQ